MRSAIKDSFSDVFDTKNKILVVTAHPDDNEIFCGGTVARLIDAGKRVRLVAITNGGKGFHDRTDITEQKFAQERVKAQIKAGLELGIPEEENFNLGIPDGEVEASLSNIERIVFHIRQFKPDILITHNPDETINTFSEEDGIRWVNHRDHRHTALVALDAAYPYCRDRGFFPQHFEKHHLKPHYFSEFLLADFYLHPQVVYFDVTDYVEKKAKSLYHHLGALSEEEIEGFLDEVQKEDGRSYEPLRYVTTD